MQWDSLKAHELALFLLSFSFFLLTHLPSLALLFTSYGVSFYSYIRTPSAVHFRLLFFDIVVTSAVLLSLYFLRNVYYASSISWLTNKVSTFAVRIKYDSCSSFWCSDRIFFVCSMIRNVLFGVFFVLWIYLYKTTLPCHWWQNVVYFCFVLIIALSTYWNKNLWMSFIKWTRWNGKGVQLGERT